MRGTTLRRALVVGTLVLALAAAATAFASVHITNITAASPTLSASLVSTGDAGFNHGNQNDAMSPILPVPPTGFGGWFNQDVTFNNLVIADPDFEGDVILTGSWYQFSTDGTTWGANTPFVNAASVSAEGLYSITATGSDDTTAPEDALPATGTLDVAFGIDKTKPASTSDAVPIYASSAIVTISATDTLSGVENLQTSVDGGPWDWSSDADPGSMFTVPVSFGPGFHTLSWHAFDNAGNIDSHSVSFIVRPDGFVPDVSLLVTVGRGDKFERHNVTFAGNVSPIATTMPITLTIQRWRPKSKTWQPYSSYVRTIPMFTSSYSLRPHIVSDDRFRVRASFDGRTTAWTTFMLH